MRLMINVKNMVPDFIGRLAEDEYFDDIKLIRAYPNAMKPTLLRQAIVAVSTICVEAGNESLGQYAKEGTCSVQASVYVPFSMDCNCVEEAVLHICGLFSDRHTVSVSVSETVADRTTECYVKRAVFTFRNELDFNGEQNE